MPGRARHEAAFGWVCAHAAQGPHDMQGVHDMHGPRDIQGIQGDQGNRMRHDPYWHAA